MNPEERARAVKDWNELKAKDPQTAEFLDPFIRKFGMTSLLYVKFSSPVPEPRHQSKHGTRLEALVPAFPEETRKLLSLLDEETSMAAEAKVWTGEVVHSGGRD